ncbi:MAG TPA: ABC transporter permease [Pirellulales bacterium]|nr:ABC transporter permease [Pirellulales bacterium]
MAERVIALIVKELLALWRDRKSRLILIVPPIFQMLVFSFAATEEAKNVRIVVLNRDSGTASRDLLARFEGSRTFTRIDHLGSDAELARAIDSRQALMALHIPPDFSREVSAGRPAKVQLVLDGRRSNAAQLVAGYSASIIDAYGADLPRKQDAPRPASVVVARTWFNPNLLSTWHSVPSLVAILTTLMGLVVTALSVARERELGTFEQLLVSPLSPAEIIVGKTAPALLVGISEATVMILVGVFAFHIPLHGSLPLLYGAMVVYLLAVIGVGLFISALSKTQQQAILGAFVFMVPAMLLSGFASPIENMPDWLQYVSYANPIRYFMVIVKGIFLKDMPAAVAIGYLWPMAIIAAVTLSAATWLFRRRME